MTSATARAAAAGGGSEDVGDHRGDIVFHRQRPGVLRLLDRKRPVALPPDWFALMTRLLSFGEAADTHA